MKNDFSDSELTDIIEKFNKIGFNCKYQSFNTLMVTFDYENYHLTIHKINEMYCFIVYRPGWGQFIDLSVNSYNCQEVFPEKNYQTIDELIENVKDIKKQMIDNSVIFKDIFQDIINTEIQRFLTIYERDYKSANLFTDKLLLILDKLYKLFNNIIDKSVSEPKTIKHIQLKNNYQDIKEICYSITTPLQSAYRCIGMTSTDEFISKLKDIRSSLRALGGEMINETKAVLEKEKLDNLDVVNT